jgi:hypothetical protein
VEENVADTTGAGYMDPHKIITSLHDDCSNVIAASCHAKYSAHNASSYGFANDLDLWVQSLSDRPESALFQTASSEFVLALLNNSQGQYRNAFKGLRLVLELILQGAYLSVYPVLLSEWLRSQADTSWQAILDREKGVFAVRYCRAFFPQLAEQVGPAKTLAETLYREMSECTHGNVPNKIPLPKTIAFDGPTFELWHEKVRTLRLVANLVFTIRYLSQFPDATKEKVKMTVLDELGHIEQVRQFFGG